MEDEHDSHIAGQFATYKIVHRVRANFYWRKMDQQITEYVCSYNVYHHNKVIRHMKYRLLAPIDDPITRWTSISMDFLVGLPKSEGYTKIASW